MERIRCPYCNAVNQDVEPTDNCWQCGKRLGRPTTQGSTESRTEIESQTEIDALSTTARNVAAAGAPRNSEPQITQTLEERVAARKASRKPANYAVPFIVIAVTVLAIVILFFAMHR